MQSAARASTSPPRATTEERRPHKDDWRPNKGPQTRFLTLTCHEALYGGAAGGGKSDALLVDASRYIGKGYGPGYHAILFRRTFPELKSSLIKRSKDLYPRLGGHYNKNDYTWTFPAGEIVQFAHLQHEDDVHVYQGSEFQFIGFDELTSFELSQYTYLFSRCRSSRGVRTRIRAATNPGNDGHAWVKARFGPWLDSKHSRPAGPGEVRYFIRDEENVEHEVPKGTLDYEGLPAIGRTFLPARLDDTPQLANDIAYKRALRELDPVRQAQLRNGDWDIQPGAGEYFKKDWFAGRFLDAAPEGLVWVRAWDLASTRPSETNPNPDWTRGVKIAAWPGKGFVIGHVASTRDDPGGVEDFVKATAETDAKAVAVKFPQDPGQAGKSQIAALTRLLSGWDIRTCRPSKGKVERAGPLSAQCKAGNVYLVRGEWNEAFLEEAESFPARKKDQIDAASDGFDEVAEGHVEVIPADDEPHESDYHFRDQRGY